MSLNKAGAGVLCPAADFTSRGAYRTGRRISPAAPSRPVRTSARRRGKK